MCYWAHSDRVACGGKKRKKPLFFLPPHFMGRPFHEFFLLFLSFPLLILCIARKEKQKLKRPQNFFFCVCLPFLSAPLLRVFHARHILCFPSFQELKSQTWGQEKKRDLLRLSWPSFSPFYRYVLFRLSKSVNASISQMLFILLRKMVVKRRHHLLSIQQHKSTKVAPTQREIHTSDWLAHAEKPSFCVGGGRGERGEMALWLLCQEGKKETFFSFLAG